MTPMFREPTPQEVQEFWAYMTTRFDTRVLDKRSSVDMQVVAMFLERIGAQDRERFMRGFTTTIGGTIYVPFDVGVEAPVWDLWTQTVICVHEHQHVVQDREKGGLGFEWDYITNSAARTQYEIEAYRGGNMEMNWRYRRIIPDVAHIARTLKTGYMCSDLDAEVAEKALLIAVRAIKAGAITTEAGEAAIEWLDPWSESQAA
jgi:hypothetical protein